MPRAAAALTVVLVAGVVSMGGRTERYASPNKDADVRSAPDLAKADHPQEAVTFRRLQLQDENGYIPPDGLIRAHEDTRAMRMIQSSFLAPQGSLSRNSWTWLGPGNIGGRIRSILVDPTAPSTLYLGSVGGGIWKSTNAGASWRALDDFMANLAVSTMVMQPGLPTTIYAGTGEGFYNGDAIRGAGIFQSTDAGNTWAQLPSTSTSDFYDVNRLAISPNGATMLAATDTGLFRSADRGTTWTLGIGTQAVGDVLFSPSDSQQAIAGGLSGGVWHSADGGVTWAAAGGTAAFTGRVEVAYAPSNPATTYISVDHSSGEIWKSADGGATYTIVSTPAHLGGQGWYDNVIWVDPTNPNRLVIGGTTLATSVDGGVTWTKLPYGQYIHPDHHAIVSDAGYNGTSDKRVYFGNDGGIYTAADITTAFSTGAITSLNNQLGITQFYGAAGNATTGTIVGGTQDNGTLRYTPAGGPYAWTVMFGGDGGFSAADSGDSNYFYGEYVDLEIHRSSNAGASSNFIYGVYYDQLGNSLCKSDPYRIKDACPDPNGPTNANFIAPFVLDPNNATRLLAGGQSLWRTNDVKTAYDQSSPTGGPTWSAIKPPTGAPSYNGLISAIAVAPGNSDIVWVGHNNGDVYVTGNGTAATPTWTKVGATVLPARFVMQITIDSKNSSIVYVTFGGFTSNNIWRTANGGSTWTAVVGSGAFALPAAPVRSLAISPSNDQILYAGTEVGVFDSTDSGQTWNVPQQGPANVSVDQLFVVGGTLVAVTHGRGVFTTTVGGNPLLAVDTPANQAGLPEPFSVAGWAVDLGSASGTGVDQVQISATPLSGGATTLLGTASYGSARPDVGALYGSRFTNSGFGFTVTSLAQGSYRLDIAAHSTVTATYQTKSVNVTIGPTLTASPASLNFGAINSGGTLSAQTPGQTFQLIQSGAGTLTWTASASQPWVQVSPSSGTGSGVVTVSVSNSGNVLPASGTVSATISVSASGAANGPQSVGVSLVVYKPGTTTSPFGAVDTPADGTTGVTGSLGITGWALDSVGIKDVWIDRDRTAGDPAGPSVFFIGYAVQVAGARPDVATAYPTLPENALAGWGYLLLTNVLPNKGNGTYTFHVYADSVDGQTTLVGSRTVTCTNATATAPFGAIDTPAQGATVSGASYLNFGWALTPLPKSIPVDGSTINVVVDGVSLGHPTYNQYRSDIALLFPGLANSNGPVGYLTIDTTRFGNGVHTIAWGVTDNQGAGQGIGSRYFTVQNGSGAAPASAAASRASRPAGAIAQTVPAARTGAVLARWGYDDVAPWHVVTPAADGTLVVRGHELDRVQVRLGDGITTGNTIVGKGRGPLPIGSTLADGVFSWQPGVGFVGSYDLVFGELDPSRALRLRIVLAPRTPSAPRLQLVIDTPTPGSVVSEPFLLAGWALDRSARSGTGIDALHVWAYPLFGDSAAPIFVGVATYGGARPDVGQAMGDAFTDVGYGLNVAALPAGMYDLAVFPHLSATGQFGPAQVVRVRVR